LFRNVWKKLLILLKFTSDLLIFKDFFPVFHRFFPSFDLFLGKLLRNVRKIKFLSIYCFFLKISPDFKRFFSDFQQRILRNVRKIRKLGSNYYIKNIKMLSIRCRFLDKHSSRSYKGRQVICCPITITII